MASRKVDGIDMATIGRYLIAFFFIASGLGKLVAFRKTSGILASIGFPVPSLSLAGFIAIEIVGGIGLLLNLWTSYVAIALIAFLVLATITVHARFVRDPVAGTDQVVHIIKNIAIIGGLITFVVF
jgi:putative oxidoreductase